MIDKFTKNDFMNSINEYDNSYQKFYNNHIPAYKEFYVESKDDAEFYGYYLADLYRVPKLSKLYGCNGKKEVLREYSKYKGKKAGFIVDLDYLPIDKNKYEKVIVTTGYSMENFYFYKVNNNFNFEVIFEHYYPNDKIRKLKLEQYLSELNHFKEQYLLYFAYFKTCMEFSTGNNMFNSHIKIKQMIDTNNNVELIINNELASLNNNFKVKFTSKYKKNIDYLRESNYMMLRGHDVFDHLINFLKEDGKYVKVSEVLKLASKMEIPEDFENQIRR